MSDQGGFLAARALANAFALPRAVEAQQQQAQLNRALLAGLGGMTPEQAAQASPDPRLGWLSAGQQGTAGKILGPIGDVGLILSSVLGNPVPAPRVGLGQAAALSQVGLNRQKQEAAGKAAQTFTDPRARAVAGTGNFNAAARLENPAQGRQQYSLNALLDQRSKLDPSDPEYERLGRVIDQAQRFRVDTAVAQGSAMTPIIAERNIQQNARDIEQLKTKQTTAAAMAAAPALDSLRALRDSVAAAGFAKDIAHVPMRATALKWAATNGEKNALRVETARQRLDVIISGLQSEKRISDQDAIRLRAAMPSFLDTEQGALNKVDFLIEDVQRSIHRRQLAEGEPVDVRESGMPPPATLSGPQDLGDGFTVELR